MSGINQILRQSDPFEQLVQQLITLESRRKFELEEQKEKQQATRKAVTDVGSQVSSFNSLLTNYQQPSSSAFRPLSANSTSDAVSVTASEFLRESANYSINVTNLAQADIVTSSVFQRNGTELTGSGVVSFTIAIGSDDPVSVTVDTDSFANNEEVLTEVRRQINDSLGSRVSVNVFSVNSNEIQLSIRSRETGSDNRINVSGAPAIAGFTNLVADPNDLNARFTIDGVSFQRANNTITDAISNLTINLRATTTGSETISVNPDTEQARSEIDKFIRDYNAIVTDIRAKTFLNPESGDRGPLQSERAFRTFLASMRNSLLQSVNSAQGRGGFVDAAETFEPDEEGISSFEIRIQGGGVATISLDTTGLTREQALNEIRNQINASAELNSVIEAQVVMQNGNARLEISQLTPGTPTNVTLSGAQGEANLISSLSLAGIQTIRNVFDLGLNFNQNGTLRVEDSNRLNEVLRDKGAEVQRLFSASDGLAANLQTEVDRLVRGNNSVIRSLQNTIDSRISTLDDRISRQEEFLKRREVQLRNEFIQLQQLIEASQSQFQQLQFIQAGLFF